MSSTRKKKIVEEVEQGVVRFALRDPNTGLYWDCQFPKVSRNRRFYWESRSPPPVLEPVFQAQPTYHARRNFLSTIYTKYEIERRCRAEGLSELPKLEMVELRAVFTVATTSEIEIDDNIIQAERIKRIHGTVVGDAANILVQRGERLADFEYAIKRKGSTFLLLQESMPEARNANMVTFLKSEKDLFQAKLLISESITKVYKLR
jgi:hypothetical protein